MDPVWIGVVSFAAVFVVGLIVWLLFRRGRGSTARDAIAAVAIERLDDVLVPDGMGGEIHLEHLLLTARGILVVNVKHYKGVIFASERMDQWTAIGPDGRSTFKNPLASLYDRVAAVRGLVRDIEVTGYLLFPSQADFSKGRPDDVILPEDLVDSYAKPDKSGISQVYEAFQPLWDRVCQSVRPASS